MSTPETGITSADLDQLIADCASNDPCAASWQAAYVWHSDQLARLAYFQAFQAVAFGVLEYASADRATDRQYEIADRQMRIAEEEYQRYKDHYVECEDALAAEICAMECPDADYDTRADRAIRDVRRQFSVARETLNRNRMRYCAHDTLVDICNLGKAEALAAVQARDTAYRYSESYRDVLDEKRWTRRVTILQHGRNIMSGQSSTYDSGAGAAIQALAAGHQARANLLGTISGAIGSVLNANAARRIAAQNPIVSNTNFNSRPFNTEVGGFGGGQSGGFQSGIAPYPVL